MHASDIGATFEIVDLAASPNKGSTRPPAPYRSRHEMRICELPTPGRAQSAWLCSLGQFVTARARPMLLDWPNFLCSQSVHQRHPIVQGSGPGYW